MLLLHLSYVPDSVVAKLDFEEGWQARFKKNMHDYKKAWSKGIDGAGDKWKYQDSELEAQYLAFKDKTQASDPVFQGEKARIAAMNAVKHVFSATKKEDEEAPDVGDSFKRMVTSVE